MGEVETIVRFVSDLTHSPFQVREPFLSYSIGKSKWFIGCPDAYYAARAPYLTEVWADKEDNIWLESMELGNTIEWTEQLQSERLLPKLQKMDLTDFAKPEVRKEFGKTFPRVLKRLNGYESVVARVSLESGIHLEIRYDAEKTIVGFNIGAKILVKGLDLQSKLEKIRAAAEALRKACDGIDEYDDARFNNRIPM